MLADMVNDFCDTPGLDQIQILNLFFKPDQRRTDSFEGRRPGPVDGTSHAFEARGCRQVVPEATIVPSVRGM